MNYFKLNNGMQMPVLGYGCSTLGRSVDDWKMEPDGDYRPLFYALEAGYRYFDDAIDYHNEPALGLFLAESGIPREELFISTKIPEREKYIASAEVSRAFITRSLERFKTDHLDMLLIHRPSKNVEGILRTWHVMEDMYDEGKLRAIGVSNFERPLLKTLMQEARIKPMVNQIMMNPGVWHRELADFCFENDIRPTAWSPLRFMVDDNIATLSAIGKKYGKNWAQVMLRHFNQRGIVVVPKSHNRERVAANLDIFDFELTGAELDSIMQLKGVEMEFKL